MNTKQTVNITDIQHLDNADLTAEFAPSLNREGVGDMLKETYVTGVFVSRQGECYHNGKKINVQRRQTYGKKGGKTTFIVIKNHGKSKCFSFAKLIASAFIEGYDWQNDRIVYKDGDSFNCDIENLLIVKPADFSKYSRIGQMNEAKRINREQMRAEMDAHGFVWRKCSEPFLECTSEGLFRYKGFPVNSYTRVMKRNHGKECKHRYLCLNIDGCRGGRNKRLTASKMIASAWKVGYDPETDFIAYKDGNPANIRLDNLVIVNEKDYNKYVTRNSHSKGITQVEKYDERLQTALAVQHDSAMAVRFLQTGDYTEINAHVEKVVIPKLREYLIYRKRQSESLATYLLTSIIEILYCKLDSGFPICNYLRFCTKTADRWIKKKRFEHWMFDTPEQPFSEVIRMKNEEINIEGLAEKFNVVRQYNRKNGKKRR